MSLPVYLTSRVMKSLSVLPLPSQKRYLLFNRVKLRLIPYVHLVYQDSSIRIAVPLTALYLIDSHYFLRTSLTILRAQENSPIV